MSLQTVIYGPDGAQLQQHTSKQHRLGTQLLLPDARVFRYCYAGAAHGGLARAAINANYIPGATGQEDVDGFEGAPSNNYAVGARSIEFPDTTARVIDYYEGAYLVSFASGHYQTNRVQSSALGDGATVVVELETGLTTAITTSTGITVYRSPYSNVRAASAINATYEPFVCVPTRPVTSGNWFWGQTAGPCPITAHGGTWPGSAASQRSVFFWQDGTIDPASVADPSSGFQRAGYLLGVTVSGYGDLFIFLQLE